MDEAAHRHWAGASNAPILANLARLSALPGRPALQVRVPLIPGVTDTRDNLGAIVAFMTAHELPDLALLPYNAAAGDKYEWLGRDYALRGEPQSPAQLQAWVAQAAAVGIHATIG
jgi:pyruvate formate lyase activating enzyme